MTTTPPTTHMQAVQEAAERLRRCLSGENRQSVYGVPPGTAYELWLKDKATLADAYLALCPPEPRPVAMECPAEGSDAAFMAHALVGAIPVRFNGKRWENWTYFKCWTIVTGDCYPTEAAARLALHWQLFDRFQEFCAKEGT